MNFQQQEQFYQVMSRLSSRAASTPEERITEMVNGLLVSKSKPAATAKEPVVIDLQEYAKGKAANASVPTNKLKEIHNFIRSNGRL